MIAVISDIHGNLEALTAVLADVKRHRAETVYNLGDLVGYGPNPVECVKAVMGWPVSVIGNFDQEILFDDGYGFSGRPTSTVEWTRAAFREQDRLFDWLAELPRSHTGGDFFYLHGSPRNPVNEYLVPEDIYNQRKMDRIGALMERYCLCGHTHVPGVFVQTDAGPWEFASPTEHGPKRRLDGRKSIVNVGSVGQPRDGDWRACYVLLDGWDVTFRRVEYDVDATVRKIHDNPDLDDLHGDRLREGR